MYVPAPPAPPRERSILGRVTVSVALIVVGVLIGWNARHRLRRAGAGHHRGRAGRWSAWAWWSAPTSAGPAGWSCSACCSPCWCLRRRWPTSRCAAASGTAPGGRPRSSDLHDPYRLGVGQSELDLTQLDLASAGRTRVEIRQGVGHLLVIVPDNVVVRVVADANAGEVLLPGQHSVNGTDLSERVVLPEGSAPSAAVLVVDAELGVGSLEVRRETP